MPPLALSGCEVLSPSTGPFETSREVNGEPPDAGAIQVPSDVHRVAQLNLVSGGGVLTLNDALFVFPGGFAMIHNMLMILVSGCAGFALGLVIICCLKYLSKDA